MKIKLDVDVHHLARVEGHGNIRVRVRDGRLVEARWQVVETPRYFEVMLKGKHYTTAPILAARICGICSIAHCLTSLEATEHAFGIEPPPAAAKLRLLAKHGETLQSHALHLFFLAAPDFLGVDSVLPLIESQPELVQLAARIKRTGNELCDLVAGRTTHPVALCVGGVSATPDPERLDALGDDLERVTSDLDTAVELFLSLDVPAFERETEFVSLKGSDDYPFIGREMISTDGVERGADDYREMTNEWVPDDSTSKWCKLSRESFAVGPLARFNNNASRLHPAATETAATLGLQAVCHNPFANNTARLVEAVHAAHESLALIEELAAPGALDRTSVPVTPRAGRGAGAVEAPRGILYHEYEYDAQGRIARADCVIPTTQNHANIQADLEALVRAQAAAGTTDEKLELLCSMLVRAYDPCISCSVH
jgi:coenzyme F420-reducing hydrogenase alpha subunit